MFQTRLHKHRLVIIMKAATGELQLTVITMIAIAAIIGFFWLMWPNIQESITSQWGNISDDKSDGNRVGGTVQYIIR